MSDLSKDLEALAGDMGFNLSEQEPTQENPAEQQTETPEEPLQEVEDNVQQDVQQFSELEQEEYPTEPSEEYEVQSSLQEEEISEEEMEAVMLEYLSERLGRSVSSFDEIGGTQNTSVDIDERVAAINEFVRQTGRDPQDWFTYQSMNPSEMDDVSAIRTQLKSQYGDLSNEDLNLLIGNKYKLDADLYDESEVRLAQIQLKMDADKARQEIEGLRSQYATPARQEQAEEIESIVNEEWLGTMSAEVDALDGIEFEVAKDKSFTFGLNDSYKTELKSKNENIEDFFGEYVSDNGQWDFEKWNMHQAVLDNIETIVRTAYQQGLGEGQRGLVDRAANVQYQQPNQVGNTGGENIPNIEEQIKNALGLNDNGLTFKI